MVAVLFEATMNNLNMVYYKVFPHPAILPAEQEEFAWQEMILLILKVQSDALVILRGGIRAWECQEKALMCLLAEMAIGCNIIFQYCFDLFSSYPNNGFLSTLIQHDALMIYIIT